MNTCQHVGPFRREMTFPGVTRYRCEGCDAPVIMPRGQRPTPTAPPRTGDDAEIDVDRVALLDAWELLTRTLGSPLPLRIYEAWGIVTVAIQQMQPARLRDSGGVK